MGMDKFYKTPSFEEIQRLEETESSCKSNLFQLQVNECLSHVRVNYDATKNLQDFLRNMKGWILDADAHSIVESVKKSIDLSCFPYEDHVELEYAKPTTFSLVGSYLLKTCAKPTLNVDVAIQYGKEIFKDKDYLNYRYFKKRWFLLKCLAEILKERGLEVEFELSTGSDHKPTLIIKKNNDLGDFVVRIHPSIELTTFGVQRLAPLRNCIRAKLLQIEGEDLATPFYNAEILKDMLFVFHMKYLHSVFGNNNEIRNALLLLKVWSKQRDFYQSEGLNGFVLSMILGYLYSSSRITKEMSSFHILRIALEFLAEDRKVYTMCNNKGLAKDFDLENFQECFPHVLVDPSGMLNLFMGISAGTFQDIQNESKLSLLSLKNSESEDVCFSHLFLRKIDPRMKFDALVQIKIELPVEDYAKPSSKRKSPEPDNEVNNTEYFKFAGNKSLMVQSAIESSFRTALGDRIRLLKSENTGKTTTFSSDCNKIEYNRQHTVFIGILVNSSTITRTIDLGPLADDHVNAAEFRNFWKDKAELRRFKDGSIREAVVWNNSKKFNIFQDIIRFAYETHVGHLCQNYEIQFSNGDLELPDVEEQGNLQAVFNRLVKEIKAIDELPICVNQMAGVSPSLRNTNGTKTNFHEFYLEFESSGKWPEDITAAQYLKLALLNALAKSLEEKHGYKCNISQLVYLDILVEDNIFRCIVYHPRELYNVRNQKNLVNCLTCFYPNRVRIAEMTRQCYHKYPVVFRSSVKLIKKWLHSHLCFESPNFHLLYKKLLNQLEGNSDYRGCYYFNHMSNWSIFEDMIDMIIVKLFSDSNPYEAPGSGVVALMRFLSFLSDELNGSSFIPRMVEPSIEQLKKYQDNVDKKEFNNFSGIMKICPEFDPLTSAYVVGHTIVTADENEHIETLTLDRSEDAKEQKLRWNRIQTLANSSLKYLESGGDLGVIFNTPLTEFDALIVLENSPDLPSGFKVLNKKSKLNQYANVIANLPNFDSIKYYVHDLEREMGKIAMFFYDPSSPVIGVVWKRYRAKIQSTLQLVQKKGVNAVSLKQNVVYPVQITNVDEYGVIQVEPNVNVLFDEMISLGSDLVESIIVIK
jgi:U3 small nucleolar RNA-associated protein 22